MKRFFTRATLASGLLLTAAPAVAETISGTGRAPITKDVESVRASAAADARRQIVVAMLTATIGADRLREVPAATIDAIAMQIRPDMITAQNSAREGGTFSVMMTADIDGGWFRGHLDNYGIASSSLRADGDRQLVFVMLDQVDGVASNFATPAETTVAYDRRTGASFNDQSSLLASSRDSAASTSRSANASSASGSGAFRSGSAGAYRNNGAVAYGASSPDGSVAGRARTNSAGGYSSNAAGAYSGRSATASKQSAANARSSASTYADRTDVQAEVHDDVTYREHVVYQRPAANSDGDAIMSALKGTLSDYGVATADSWGALSRYFNGQPPRYAALKRDVRYQPFLSSLKASNAPFFLGGSFSVTHAGTDPATGQARCSGSLDASASATADGRDLASGLFNASGAGMSPEECSRKVAASLASAAAIRLGPKIQNYWRGVARGAVGQDTRQTAEYALMLRASRLDMSMQADILDALQATPGVESQNFVSQAGSEMRFTVRYAGAVPLQLALYQKLRARAGFANMQSTVQGRSILLCLSGCSTGQ